MCLFLFSIITLLICAHDVNFLVCLVIFGYVLVVTLENSFV